MSTEIAIVPAEERSAEIALLGALLIDPKLMTESTPIISDPMMLSANGQRLYAAIQACWERHQTVDLILVMAEVEEQYKQRVQDLAAAGLEQCPMSKNARRYADILQRRALRNETLNQAVTLREAVESGDSPARVREHIEALVALIDGVPGESTLQPFDLREVMDEPDTPVPYVIDGWLAKRDFAIIGGEPFTGKSVFALDLSIALASGTQFLGKYKVEDQYRVLYLDEEMPPTLARRRIRQILSGRMLEPEQVALEYYNSCKINLDRPESRLALRVVCDRFQPQWIVFDSLVRFHQRDENSNSEMSRFFEIMKSFRDEFDAGLIALHHLAKPGGKDASKKLGHRLRGASDMEAVVDQLWGLTGETSTDVRTLEHEKNRWGHMSPPMTMVWNESDDGRIATLTGDTQSRNAEQVILDLLEKAGKAGCPRAVIVQVLEADHTKASAAKISTSALGKLKKLSLVGMVMTGRNAHYWHKEFAPQGSMFEGGDAD